MKKHHILGMAQWLLLQLILLLLFLKTGLVPLAAAVLILILLPPVSLLWNRLVSRRCGESVTLQLVKRGAKGEESCAVVSVPDRVLLSVGRHWCRLLMRNELTGEEVRLEQPIAHGTFAFPMEHCGRMLFRVERLWITDYLGMIPRRRSCGAQCRMTVLPETFPVNVDARLLMSASDDGEVYEEGRRGNDPTEILQLREYVAGDPVRSIHWKLSSKLDQLIVKEPSLPVDRSLLIYWDRQVGSPAVLDALAEAIFSLCQALSESGVVYTLGWMEDGFLRLQEITGVDELPEYLPLLLRRSGTGDTRLPDLSAFGRILYFTGAMTEAAMGSGTKVFLCRDTMEAVEGATVFTPENYREKLDYAYEF